jgi:pantetheine-phosphate adenylyltransferase
MIERGAATFDKLIVAIGINPKKRYMFSLEDRLEMIRQSIKQLPNVEPAIFPYKLLVKYAESLGAQFILRGIRDENDYEYERGMRNFNGDLNPDITTYFLMPPRGLAETSSSMVKELLGVEGWEEIVKKFVPEPVFEKLKEVHHAE